MDISWCFMDVFFWKWPSAHSQKKTDWSHGPKGDRWSEARQKCSMVVFQRRGSLQEAFYRFGVISQRWSREFVWWNYVIMTGIYIPYHGYMHDRIWLSRCDFGPNSAKPVLVTINHRDAQKSPVITLGRQRQLRQRLNCQVATYAASETLHLVFLIQIMMGMMILMMMMMMMMTLTMTTKLKSLRFLLWFLRFSAGVGRSGLRLRFASRYWGDVDEAPGIGAVCSVKKSWLLEPMEESVSRTWGFFMGTWWFKLRRLVYNRLPWKITMFIYWRIYVCFFLFPSNG